MVKTIIIVTILAVAAVTVHGVINESATNAVDTYTSKIVFQE